MTDVEQVIRRSRVDERLAGVGGVAGGVAAALAGAQPTAPTAVAGVAVVVSLDLAVGTGLFLVGFALFVVSKLRRRRHISVA